MLQKILVVIVGLIMSIVGAIAPEGLFAAREGGGDGPGVAANTAEQTLATLRTTDGQAFARIPILWAEVDGRRVVEDAWGTGEVDELRFKVGVKGVDAVALAVGEKIVEIHPTDILTIRMFRGDFSYRGVGTPQATLQLQGTVKTTVLNEGSVPNRVLTRVGELPGTPAPVEDDERVAYVVLTTGRKVDTVAVESGGSRLFTEEAPTADAAKNEPGNLLAKWVKLDGKNVREYTWGDGQLAKVEFEPAEGATNSVVLAWNGESSEVAAGERVVVEDFVGEYLFYQVSGGMMRVRLDGYARTYGTAAAIAIPQPGGVGSPIASFEFTPASPKTTDTIRFKDRSTDDGIIVFRQWEFGDGASGVLPEPTHRFARPGTYDVTLTVTDNDLQASNVTRTIIVRNADPVTDFDFSPKVATTDTIVAFSDRSYDSDGTIVNWTWNFGDGAHAYTRHPSHRYTRGGEATVTLTTVDELGGRSSLSKVINVRNAPPLASFTYSPAEPLTLDPVQFIDNSTDRDGRIVRWNWSFGDGQYGAGSNPVHAYARPGLFTVSLTVTDDAGDSDTASTTILVGNRPPFPDFTWNPQGEPASTPITFTSTSSDPDGVVLLTRWNWGDGTAESVGGVVTHTFPAAGTYKVTLTVTDNTLGTSTISRSVTVANSAPRANMAILPSPAFRGVDVVFTDTSVDPDGDSIVNATWDFGDGATAFGRSVRHAYGSLGTFTVTLVVRDADDQESTIQRTIRILNRPPTISADFGPRPVVAGEVAAFTATGVDPDLPSGAVTFEWTFSDGQRYEGAVVARTFARHGNYSFTVRGYDSEGGISAPILQGFSVAHARPFVNFSWSPGTPSPGALVNFTDLSSSLNGPIRDYRWDFGDGSSDALSSLANPSHVFRAAGNFTVSLRVTDVANQTNVTSRSIVINIPPAAKFDAPTEGVQLGEPIDFEDLSVDVDGDIVNWTWDLGDGTFSYQRHPRHPGYTEPGAYVVKLTVRDDQGATATATKTINVANSAPIAAWARSVIGGGEPMVNSTVLFYGYDHSSDPDGQPIVRWEWNFGDGSPLSHSPNTSHQYTRSGRYVVGLIVADGLRESARTPDSHQPLHVLPGHDVRISITASLPDGSVAPISSAPYVVTARVAGQLMDNAAFTPVGAGLEVRVPAAAWVNNDQALIRVAAPFLSGPMERTLTLQDGIPTLHVHFQLRLAASAGIKPAPGERISLFAVLGQSSEHGSDPLYGDMTERPHGNGTAFYLDGTRVPHVQVDIEARWVPLRALGQYRNATETPDTATVFPNWCKAGRATTDANGAFDWSFDGQSSCYFNGVANGLYPVGRWEVRARPLVPLAENRASPTQVFYVDPTGGVLLRATLGLA